MSKHQPFFINDGYTENAFIAGVERGQASVRFSFRPAMIEERVMIVEKSEKFQSAREAEIFIAKEIADRLVSWNLVSIETVDNQPVTKVADITAKNLLSLRSPQLFNRFANIVLYGSDIGDPDPEEKPEQQEEKNQLLMESAISDKLVGDVRQSTNAKN
jgi:hypothetical protein